jgi:hypothetical protein
VRGYLLPVCAIHAAVDVERIRWWFGPRKANVIGS